MKKPDLANAPNLLTPRTSFYALREKARITSADIAAADAARDTTGRIAGPRIHVNAAMREPLPPGRASAAREGADDYLAIPSLGVADRQRLRRDAGAGAKQ